MTFSTARARHYLQSFKLEKLFIEELGWDRHTQTIDIAIDQGAFTLSAVAQKKGVVFFLCNPDSRGQVPVYADRRKIETRLAKQVYEHLIIFTDQAHSVQIWQWVARGPGRPAACREHTYHPKSQSGDALIQKFDAISFSIDDEEELTLTGVTRALKDGFDRDTVTKRFYDRFKKEHQTFLTFIKGIKAQGDRAWYASLMLNRLMFVYFIQKKGFLDEDRNYLQNRLKKVQAQKGKGKFLTFYRYFLMTLFHQGFATQPAYRKLDSELKTLVGDVPYLDGGLFDLHELETKHPDIDIDDEAFGKIFDFFDQYDWHLDNRPLSNDREINPDVLGYIFEKYINQKEMGAYYTKEDITDYISKNTIIPYLFDAAQKACKVAFEKGSPLWRLLQDNPDRYIYPAVRKGVVDEYGEVIPLPTEIAEGVDNVGRRENWNNPADSEFALPTETWREHVARRSRCLEIREKLMAGLVNQINDLITYNLDIRQFAQDAVSECEGPELLRAFYRCLAGHIPKQSNETYQSGISVLDPTCGSGAFLFAALNVLEPLYEACLERMQAFVEDLERSGEKSSPRKFEDYKTVLNDIQRHPNQKYYIYKTIIVNNLFGVDIMVEAVEICKLRLFLKLVAQVDRVQDLEPLPDIDFNIRAGNTLVGFVTREEVRRAAEWKSTGNQQQAQILLGETESGIRQIEEQAEEVERAFQQFRRMQIRYGMDAGEFAAQKQELRKRLTGLTNDLNQYLAKEYGVDPDRSKNYQAWLESHQPFHWFAEFYGIMANGGFDVVIGNPPYIVYTNSKVPYSIEPLELSCADSKNLYSYIFERSIKISKPMAPVSLIVQLSVLSSAKLETLQNLLISRGVLYVLPFPRRPESMFDGVEMPVAILLSFAEKPNSFITTRIGRFYSEERSFVIAKTFPVCHNIREDKFRIGKIGEEIEKSIYTKLIGHKKQLGYYSVKSSSHAVYYQEACRYWLKASLETPFFKKNGSIVPPPHWRILYFKSSLHSAFVSCLLNSSLFYWYYSLFSDCEHVNDSLVRKFPFPNHAVTALFLNLSRTLASSLKINSYRKTIKTKQGHEIEYDELRAYLSKSVLDECDFEIGRLYGFEHNEIDYLVHYDEKYRMPD